MSIIRTTTIICLTVLICVALFVFYGSVENRYRLVKGDNGLYIFDKNSSVTNYCNSTHCKGISSGMILPHRHDVGRIPGVPMKSEKTQSTPGNVAMTYLPIQGNQAYILQPIPQGMQPGVAHQAMPAPQPMPMIPQAPAPVPVAPPAVAQPPAPAPAPAPVSVAPPAPAPAPVAAAPVELPPAPAPLPGGAEFDEDMGFTLPESAPPATEAFFGEEVGIPEGGLPADQDTGGFEAIS